MDAAGWDERYGERELVWSAEPNRFVAEEVAAMPPGRAIDLAAGEGRNAIWLASLGWTVTAVDFSAVGLEKGRQLAEAQQPDVAGRIRWECADLLEYAPTPAGYELVLIAYLHLPAPLRQRVLTAAAGAVAPGGLLLIVGHARRNLADGVGGPQDAEVLYDVDEVSAEIAAAGLAVESAAERLRPVDGQERPAIDFVLRAHPAEVR